MAADCDKNPDPLRHGVRGANLHVNLRKDLCRRQITEGDLGEVRRRTMVSGACSRLTPRLNIVCREFTHFFGDPIAEGAHLWVIVIAWPVEQVITPFDIQFGIGE
jgi:hypothetical protein